MEVKAKEAKSLGMPWEAEYGYAQAVRSGGTVWLSGQLGHDEKGVLADGTLIGVVGLALSGQLVEIKIVACK